MIWLGMILAMILAVVAQWWSEWGFRVYVLSSLGANLVVGFLSGTRRRSAAGWWWGLLGKGAVLILWFAYQLAEAASTSAISGLSLSGSDASEEEKQVVAFWAPFLLLHLGGPDNLTAYALEDNKISPRKWLEIATNIWGAGYTIYNNTHRGGRSWALLPAASVVMLFAGAARFVERAIALYKADLDSMQEDASASSSTSSSEDDDDVKKKKKMDSLKSRIKRTKRQGRSLRDEEALLLAQDLFPIWRHALVDSSVDPASISPRQEASEMILWPKSDEWDWESMCKVAEMELSLIYEFLYTKAILAHTCTWCYYLIRLLSPLCTAAAAFLFCFWHQQQQQPQQGDDGQRVRGSFVRITYALLAITFIMDVAWLLRALGSTWAYAYLQEQAPAWLRHRVLHASGRWWRSLHRTVVRLDPLQLLCRDPVSHRRWSGSIGRYNLLDECTTTRRRQCPGWLELNEIWYLAKLPRCVKEVLFKRVTEILQQAITTEEKDGEKTNMYTRADIRTQWGHKAFRTSGECICRPDDMKEKEKRIFGKEFEEDVLLWHIATCMVLPHIRQKAIHAWAIEVMSEYMMFLVAVRRQMLPGLFLHSQLQVTRDKLVEIWAGGSRILKDIVTPGEESKMNDKEKLAMILRHVRTDEEITAEAKQWAYEIKGNEGTQLLANAVDLYYELSGEKRSRDAPSPTVRIPDETERLEFIFNVWVDKLVYAAVRCSREAHAKQLSAGGDLTTVLWMLIQHAGPFCMGEANNIYIVRPAAMPHPAQPPPMPRPAPLPPMGGVPPLQAYPPQDAPPPPYCPVCPPYYHPSYPPVCPPCYDPSCPPVCPWYPQCPPQHEKSGDEPEEASREDEDEDSSSDEDCQE